MDVINNHPAVTSYVTRVEHWARTSGVAVHEPMTIEEIEALYPGSTGD